MRSHSGKGTLFFKTSTLKLTLPKSTCTTINDEPLVSKPDNVGQID